ncbi:PAS domain-containing protein [Halovenus halobia]|uniref:sensor histidine kinase n=1 Tax=Halovenus halobia TaxID=3396622 RepID=UPI003F543671
MVPDPSAPPERSPPEIGEPEAEPRILLFMQPGRDRELVTETLSEQYQVETTTDVERLQGPFDCCLFDTAEFRRVAGTVQSKRDTASAVFLPFVLLLGNDDIDGEPWEYVDDIIDLPVEKQTLHARISNLVERRRTAAQLAIRERELTKTVDDLRLKERAMDEAPVGITIADRKGKDNPLLYINDEFEQLTGYGTEIVGADCRRLQGEETSTETTATLRSAIDAEEAVSVDILNYSKNGRKFWNKLDIAPLTDDTGTVTHYAGFQADITSRKIKERRVEVLNRVLSHNLRNKMNVIDGYTTILRDAFGDEEIPEAVEHIEEATADLIGLTDTVQKIEQTLDTENVDPPTVHLDHQIEQLVDAFEEQFPDTTFELTQTDESYRVCVPGLMTAIEEALENAATHNDNSEPAVQISLARRDDWIDVEITDNGPGIPNQEIEVLRHGETPLEHADRLGIWLIYWVVSKEGGHFSVSDAEPTGTVLELSVPVE